MPQPSYIDYIASGERANRDTRSLREVGAQRAVSLIAETNY